MSLDKPLDSPGTESENNTDDDNIKGIGLSSNEKTAAIQFLIKNVGNLTSYTFNGTFGDRIVAQDSDQRGWNRKSCQ